MAADPALQQGPHRSRADQKSEQPLRRLVCTQLVRFGRDRTRDPSRARVSPSLPCVPALTSTGAHTCAAPRVLWWTELSGWRSGRDKVGQAGEDSVWAV